MNILKFWLKMIIVYSAVSAGLAVAGPSMPIEMRDSCKSGEVRRVAEWIKRDPPLLDSLHEEASSSRSCLVAAIESGHSELANFLLDKGASPHVAMPLEAAIVKKNYSLVERLLKMGADPWGHYLDSHFQIHYSWTPAVEADDLKAVELMLAHGWDTAREIAKGTKVYVTANSNPLYIAVHARAMKTIQKLVEIKHPANDYKLMNGIDYPTSIPLGHAISDLEDNFAIVELLLKGGANPDSVATIPELYLQYSGGPHSSVLGWAAAKGDERVTQLLLQYGARVNYLDTEKHLYSKVIFPLCTAAYSLSESAGKAATMRALIAAGASLEACVTRDIGLQDVYWASPLYAALSATAYGKVPVEVKVLVESGADINRVWRRRMRGGRMETWTPVQFALHMRSPEVADYLEVRGAK